MSQLRILNRVYERIPSVLREQLGEHVYDKYLKIRRRLLGAKLGVIEGKRQISYFSIDRGHPETLVYFHGFADSKDTFYDACHFLKDRFNIVAPDLPGFGKSDKRKDDIYSLDNYAKWMADFLDNMQIESCHLVGHSLGGAVAAAVSLLSPQRIKTLTLVDPAGIFYENKYSLHQELMDGNILFDVRNEEEFEYLLDRVFYRRPVLPPPVKDYLYRELYRHSTWHRKVLSDLFQGISSEDDPKLWQFALNNRLKKIKVPTLVLWGDEDTLFPAETAYLVKKLVKNSRLHFFTDVGHCPQIEAPRSFARLVKKFISQELRHIEQERHRQRQVVAKDPASRASKPDLKVVPKKASRSQEKSYLKGNDGAKAKLKAARLITDG